jgi:signal transduction histidine kinase
MNEQRWFLMTADRLKGSSERRVIICHHNITQRVLAERKALEANNNLKQLCAMLAHDFRGPLTSVKGSITLVRKMFSHNLSEKALNCLEIAEQTADHLVALSTDFLDLQRDGSLSAQTKPHSVEDIFSSAFGLVNGIAAKQQIEIVVSTAPDLFVECDKSSILRALNNLLTNALKYSPSGKAVFLEAFAEKEQIVFSVRDEGPGIDENRLHQLFEPFGYSQPSKLMVGSGLGLAAVKRLLALNNSEVELKTARNEGTTFSFRLPRAFVAMQPEATNPRASEQLK